MQKTWMPITAGALEITCSIFAGFVAAAILSCVTGITGQVPDNQTLIIIAVPFAIACLSFAGSISALRRKNWGLALAGSISGTLICWPLGIAAIVLIVISKNEFA
jgi:hypothetical protein